MAKVQDVANFFIDLAQKQAEHETGDAMTQLRLHKLLYFAQGWHLARYWTPLFDASIVAWKNGPVVEELYSTYHKYGREFLPTAEPLSPDSFTQNEYELLLDVASEYNGHSASNLVNLTHQPRTPWAETRQSDVIPVSAIRAYFASQPPLVTTSDLLENIEIVVPARDENGAPVFPAEFDDDWSEYDAI